MMSWDHINDIKFALDQLLPMREQLDAYRSVQESINAYKLDQGMLDAISAVKDDAQKAVNAYALESQAWLRQTSLGESAKKYLQELNQAFQAREYLEAHSQIEAIKIAVEGAVRPFQEISQLELAASPAIFDLYQGAVRRINDAVSEASFVGEISLENRSKEISNAEVDDTQDGEIEEQLVDLVPTDVVSRLRMVDFVPLSLLDRILRDPELMRGLGAYDFERFVATLIDQPGFEDVVITPRSGDQGRDITAVKRVHGISIIFAFECKRYANKNPVGPEIVRALLGTIVHNQTRATKGVLVTTSTLAPSARKFILTEPSLDGRDFNDIVEWLREYSCLRQKK